MASERWGVEARLRMWRASEELEVAEKRVEGGIEARGEERS
jgi:hypothetical protein